MATTRLYIRASFPKITFWSGVKALPILCTRSLMVIIAFTTCLVATMALISAALTYPELRLNQFPFVILNLLIPSIAFAFIVALEMVGLSSFVSYRVNTFVNSPNFYVTVTSSRKDINGDIYGSSLNVYHDNVVTQYFLASDEPIKKKVILEKMINAGIWMTPLERNDDVKFMMHILLRDNRLLSTFLHLDIISHN